MSRTRISLTEQKPGVDVGERADIHELQGGRHLEDLEAGLLSFYPIDPPPILDTPGGKGESRPPALNPPPP